jgi:sec-independent protein translocase protein TatC
MESNLQFHLKELRQRAIFCVVFFVITFFLCYFLSDKIYQILLDPITEILKKTSNHKLIYTSPAEGFATFLKLSLYSSLFFSFPIFAAEFYLFLAPALYKKEKKIILSVLFFSPFLFLCGAILAYFFILPAAFEFFLSFENQGLNDPLAIPIQLETRISDYLNFVMNLIFGFGVSFQLPILLLFLIKIGFLSVNGLKHRRRYWIVMIFIVSAILTPPDVISQTCMAIPMILLLEIVILIGQFLITKK